MNETAEQRRARVRSWVANREVCRHCGFLRINVRHEPDPDNAPEGRDYYNSFRHELHAFVPSGVFDRD